MLAIRWQPWLDKSVEFSAGRLIIPFGSYSNRFLSSENAFRHLPLSHEWTLPVDKMLGYTMGQRSYGTFPGMTMIYNRMYSTGIALSGVIGESRPLEYNLLWGMAAPSGFFDYNMHGMTAIMGRIVWQPLISTRIGFSGGYGPYMKPAIQNDMISKNELADYTQFVWGADLEYSYRYVIVRFEYLRNEWSAPQIERSITMWDYLPTLAFNSTGEWKLVDRDVQFTSSTISGELEIRVAAIPGLTLVGRLDYATFDRINTQYDSYYGGPIVGGAWYKYPDLMWFEGGFNYTLSRNVRLKATYMRPTNKDVSINAQTLGAQLSVSF